MSATDTWILSLAIFDITLNLFSYIISIVFIIIFCKHKILHTNLLRQLKCFFIYFIIAQIMRLIVAGHETTKEQHFDFKNSYSTFFLHRDQGFLIACGIIRLCCLTATYLATSSAILERIYATTLLKNYENSVSNAFFAICFGYQITVGLGVAYIIYAELLNLITIGVSLLLSNIAFFSALYYLKKYNEIYYLQTLSNPSQYSLSERFQIQENFKAINVIGRVDFVLFILQLFAGAIMTGAYWFSDNSSQRIAYIFIQVIFSSYSYCAAIAGLSADPIWRSKVKQFFKSMLKNGVAPTTTDIERTRISKEVLNSKGKKMIFSLNEEAELYFQQLQQGWN